MSDVWKKLNLKDQSEIVILDAPDAFEEEVNLLGDVAVCRALDESAEVAFLLALVTERAKKKKATKKKAAKK